MGRERWLDTWRGLAVVHMVAYHTLWDMVYLFGWDIPWFETEAAFYWEQWIAWSFILISGCCAVRSRQLFRRGVEVSALGMAVTAVTIGLGEESRIYFGILTLLGSSMLIAAGLRPLLGRIPPRMGLLCAAALFCLTYTVPQGYVGLGSLQVALPEAWYDGFPSSFIGFKAPDFYSADYFPLLPWLFLFLAGYMAGCMMKSKTSPLASLHIPIISHIGRRALSVYLIHQPVIYGMMVVCN